MAHDIAGAFSSRWNFLYNKYRENKYKDWGGAEETDFPKRAFWSLSPLDIVFIEMGNQCAVTVKSRRDCNSLPWMCVWGELLLNIYFTLVLMLLTFHLVRHVLLGQILYWKMVIGNEYPAHSKTDFPKSLYWLWSCPH